MKKAMPFIALLALCCSDSSGPKPEIESVSPDEICTAAGDTLLEIRGSNFATAATDGNTDTPKVELPRVYLVSPEGEETELPSEGMTVTGSDPQVIGVIVPLNAVPPTQPGEAEIVYDLKVNNSAGNSGNLEEAVTVVPPDVRDLVAVEPPFGWEGARTPVTILADGWFTSTPSAEMQIQGSPQADPIKFEQVAFIDDSTLTAVVPAGAPVGIYDVTVRNPATSGIIGYLQSGFQVVSLPVPAIEAVVPERGTSKEDTQVRIHGTDFRDQVKVELLDSELQVAVTIDQVSPTSPNLIETVFPTKTSSSDLPAGPYLVRVTNNDESTYSTYSAFLVTNPAGNLNPFEETSALNHARRMPAGAFAKDTNGNRFVYAIGGDTGQGSGVLGTVEHCQLSRFGDLSAWTEQPHTLNVPRAGATAVAVPVYGSSIFTPTKTYLYVFGGISDSGEVLRSAERAMVLSPDEAPEISEVETAVSAGALEAGTWYYRVSAVLSTSDPDNPGGETLPSEEVVVSLTAPSQVSLAWPAFTLNGLAPQAYRIYRTDEVDGVSQTEHRIAEVTTTSFNDNGEPAGETPFLSHGSTGVFVDLGDTLTSPRVGHGSALAAGPSGGRYIYTIGGMTDTSSSVSQDVEWMSIDSNGLVGAASTTGAASLNLPRAFFALVVEDSTTISTYPGLGARLWIMGGIEDSGGATGAIEQSDLSTGGGNEPWITNSREVQSAAGIMSVLANDKLFCLGGASSGDFMEMSSVTANGRDTEFDENGDITNSVNSTANGLLSPRALGVAIKGAGFIYFIGGTSDGDDALSSCERTF